MPGDFRAFKDGRSPLAPALDVAHVRTRRSTSALAKDWRTKLAIWLSVGTLAACAPAKDNANPEPETAAPFPVVITASGDGKSPVANVEIVSGTQVLARTDQRGRATLALRGDEGERATLNVRCPAGFASPERPLVVGLRHLSAGSQPPQFEVECIRLVHSVLVGILADNGAHLPVLHLRQKVGETDEHGVAHVLLPAENDERVTLTLDTSSNPNLRPQNPSLAFVTRDHDEFVLLEHKFAVQRAAPVRRARRPGPLPL